MAADDKHIVGFTSWLTVMKGLILQPKIIECLIEGNCETLYQSLHQSLLQLCARVVLKNLLGRSFYCVFELLTGDARSPDADRQIRVAPHKSINVPSRKTLSSLST